MCAKKKAALNDGIPYSAAFQARELPRAVKPRFLRASSATTKAIHKRQKTKGSQSSGLDPATFRIRV
jgi:hypothetical protein